MENKVHKGLVLREIITKSRIKKSVICRAIGITQTTLWRWTKDQELKEELSDKILNFISEVQEKEIDVDFEKKYYEAQKENYTLKLKNKVLQEKLNDCIGTASGQKKYENNKKIVV